MGRECGGGRARFFRQLTRANRCTYALGHGTERHDPFHFGFRDFAAALVALELLFGGRLLVAMA
jgi:hypothetical protein